VFFRIKSKTTEFDNKKELKNKKNKEKKAHFTFDDLNSLTTQIIQVGLC